MKKRIKHQHPFGNLCGAAVLGERGQVVIPKEARTLIKAKTGDQFLVFEHDSLLIMIPEKLMSGMIKTITKALKIKK